MTREQRHRCMSQIKSKNTSPEWRVRKTVFAMGFRYRLHDKRLPGKPDLVFPRLKKVIFVHGCFWHRHTCQAARPLPETNRTFWETKFRRKAVEGVLFNQVVIDRGRKRRRQKFGQFLLEEDGVPRLALPDDQRLPTRFP